MNILSIDFDFFQRIPTEAIQAYPDGIDLPTKLSNITWASKIATEKNKLEKIKFDNEKFVFIQKIIKQQSQHAKIMIASSHKEAYEFIHKIIGQEKCNLTNIDLHHDMDNENPYVDCGNWIGHLLTEKKIKKFTWILQPESQDWYCLSDEELKQMYATTNIKVIEATQFDAIFICRSNPWLYPKFDTQFDELFNLCKNHFTTITAEKDITKPRQIPTEEIKSALAHLQNAITNRGDNK